nr:MAG TPA: hypothetical protein [Caudoviricetes sp.]
MLLLYPKLYYNSRYQIFLFSYFDKGYNYPRKRSFYPPLLN